MTKYTILYIDDDSAENHHFERSFYDEFNIDTVDFEGITKESLNADLSEKDFDYLIVDYHLNEKTNCGFNGDEVLINFLSNFPHFPVMLLTNHDERAIESVMGLDVEKIHSKKEYSDSDLKEAFVKRIYAKITEYKSKESEAQERIIGFIKKKASGEELTAIEEDEAIQLDKFLDETLDGKSRIIPEEIKKSTNRTRIESLLNKTDELIERLKKYETI